MRMSRRLALYAVGGGLSETGFSFDGGEDSYTFVQDGKDWMLTIKGTGLLTFNKPVEVEVFLVGGGGGGSLQGGGGGGGYTLTQRGVSLLKGEPYSIEIGSGGAGAAKQGGTGDPTSAFGFTANGGLGGKGADFSYSSRTGGDGGSGGGGGDWVDGNSAENLGRGGSDGSDGYEGRKATGGKGQGPTTRAFGEKTGELFAGGGCCSGLKVLVKPIDVDGEGSGNGGGGSGGSKRNGETQATTSGTPNTGGGGGSDYYDREYIGSGGCGVVIIRNAREVA